MTLTATGASRAVVERTVDAAEAAVTDDRLQAVAACQETAREVGWLGHALVEDVSEPGPTAEAAQLYA
jgi:hypothetical protein